MCQLQTEVSMSRNSCLGIQHAPSGSPPHAGSSTTANRLKGKGQDGFSLCSPSQISRRASITSPSSSITYLWFHSSLPSLRRPLPVETVQSISLNDCHSPKALKPQKTWGWCLAAGGINVSSELKAFRNTQGSRGTASKLAMCLWGVVWCAFQVDQIYSWIRLF